MSAGLFHPAPLPERSVANVRRIAQAAPQRPWQPSQHLCPARRRRCQAAAQKDDVDRLLRDGNYLHGLGIDNQTEVPENMEEEEEEEEDEGRPEVVNAENAELAWGVRYVEGKVKDTLLEANEDDIFLRAVYALIRRLADDVARCAEPICDSLDLVQSVGPPQNEEWNCVIDAVVDWPEHQQLWNTGPVTIFMLDDLLQNSYIHIPPHSQFLTISASVTEFWDGVKNSINQGDGLPEDRPPSWLDDLRNAALADLATRVEDE
ncbi:hypothetical protein D9Q98_004512 [Chlorella vulgaris]|uniref:Uncharacterized protein n=1 Tax=Chlorella vulgaris TaxID=3077 RepID=A0A9D4YXK5_CHLVU|nr:hypothetical protein D9Q98_004512 [Chlorella vulgaris]